MSKQCLDVQQMRHLQKLGLEIKETMMRWQLANPQGKWVLVPSNMANLKVIGIPAYTLQDILGILPTELKPAKNRYWLRIDLFDECIYYYYDDCNLVEHRKKVFGYDGIDGLIDAAYEMLCWCIEQGYVTNKEGKR